MGVPHHLIAARIQSAGAKLDALQARLDAWDESAHPRGQPTNKGQFARKGEAAEGMTVTSPAEGHITAKVNGEYAGSAHVSPGGPYLGHLHVEEAHGGRGIGHEIHAKAEEHLGRPLVPNPTGETPQGQEIWKRRFANMPTREALGRLSESRKLGNEMGVRDEHIDQHHAPYHEVIGGEKHPGHGYTKEAFIDGEGRIHTHNVNDAARALYEGRQVVLAQPREVSTLIQHLGRVSAEFIRLGGNSPTFDLCKVSVENTNLFCAESKGIPRVQMPQMNRKETKRFIEHLKSKGYKVKKETEKAEYLRATQNELNGAKVAANAEKLKDMADEDLPRLVVSRDNYVLDGHHRWAALLGLDALNNKFERRMPISRVDIDITDLLGETKLFGARTGASVASGTPGQEQPQPGATPSPQHRADAAFGLTVEEVAALRWTFRLDAYDPDEPRDEKGEWTSGGGAGPLPDLGMVSASPDSFVAARDHSTRPVFLSAHPASELQHHTLLTSRDGKAGVSVSPDGDIQNVFNNGGPKGAGQRALVAAIAAGGRTLDCYDGHLCKLYHQFGFEEDARMKFDPAYAPPGADKNWHPDIVFMSWRGYKQGGAKAALDRAATTPRESWPAPERSKVYVDDWDAAKRASRAAASTDAGRTEVHRGTGAAGGTGRADADRAGDRARTLLGEGLRLPAAGRAGGTRRHLTIVRADAYNPNEPRIPKGEPGGGRWTKGGAGLGFTEDKQVGNTKVWNHTSGNKLAVSETGRWRYFQQDPDGKSQTISSGSDTESLNKFLYDQLMPPEQKAAAAAPQPPAPVLGPVEQLKLLGFKQEGDPVNGRVTLTFNNDRGDLGRIHVDPETGDYSYFSDVAGFKHNEEGKDLRFFQFGNMGPGSIFGEEQQQAFNAALKAGRIANAKRPDDPFLGTLHDLGLKHTSASIDPKEPMTPLQRFEDGEHKVLFNIKDDGWRIWDADDNVIATGDGKRALLDKLGETLSGEQATKAREAAAKLPVDLNRHAIDVSGDEWTQKTARRLETEYQTVKPALGALGTAIVESPAYKDFVKKLPAEPKTAAGSGYGWADLDSDAQDKVKDKWIEDNESSWKDNESDNWQQSDEATQAQASKVIADYEDGSETDWASEAVDEVKDRWEEEHPGKPIPYSTDALLGAMTLGYENQLEVGWTDDNLKDPDDLTYDPEKQGVLPGFRVPPPEQHLTEGMRDTIERAVQKAFDKQVDKTSVETPDYVYDDLPDQMSDYFNDSMPDTEKYENAVNYLDPDELPGGDEDSDSAIARGVDPGLNEDGSPKAYDPLNESSGRAYRATQYIARQLSYDRAKQLLESRGIIKAPAGDLPPVINQAKAGAAFQKGVTDILRKNPSTDGVVDDLVEHMTQTPDFVPDDMIAQVAGRLYATRRSAVGTTLVGRQPETTEEFEKVQRFLAKYIASAYVKSDDDQYVEVTHDPKQFAKYKPTEMEKETLGVWGDELNGHLETAIMDYVRDHNRAREAADVLPKIKQADSQMWEDWKGSSTSDLGRAIQVATSEELGGRLRIPAGPKIDYDPKTVPEISKDEIAKKASGSSSFLSSTGAPDDDAAKIGGAALGALSYPFGMKHPWTLDITNSYNFKFLAAQALAKRMTVTPAPKPGSGYRVSFDKPEEAKIDWGTKTEPSEQAAKDRAEVEARMRTIAADPAFAKEVEKRMSQKLMDLANSINEQRQEKAKNAAIVKWAGGGEPSAEKVVQRINNYRSSANLHGNLSVLLAKEMPADIKGSSDKANELAFELMGRKRYTSSTGMDQYVTDVVLKDGKPHAEVHLDRLPKSVEVSGISAEQRAWLAEHLQPLADQVAREAYDREYDRERDRVVNSALAKYQKAVGKAWPTREEVKATADEKLKDVGGYEGLKAMLRAKWETSQYLMDKAGLHKLNTYRGMGVPDLDKEATEDVQGSGGRDYERLKDFAMLRSGAASTTTDRKVANGWADGGSGKMTLRIQIPRTAVISLPAYGINVHSEHEVVAAGTAWKSWDAWKGKAPSYEEVPITHHSEKPPDYDGPVNVVEQTF